MLQSNQNCLLNSKHNVIVLSLYVSKIKPAIRKMFILIGKSHVLMFNSNILGRIQSPDFQKSPKMWQWVGYVGFQLTAKDSPFFVQMYYLLADTCIIRQGIVMVTQNSVQYSKTTGVPHQYSGTYRAYCNVLYPQLGNEWFLIIL